MEYISINKRIIVSAADLAGALNKGKVSTSGQCKACCPAHDDANPSLSIYDGENGNILLYCHAGCTYEQIITALGLQGISLNHNTKFERYPGLPEGILYKFEGKDYCAHWPYTNEKGVTIGYVARYESVKGEKAFIPYFKHEGPKWKAGYLNTGERPLYNLDKIYRNIYDPVWIVEGEKCSDILSKFSLLSTTSPGGAKAALKTDWTPLSGRHVIIWPDNDEAGKVYAASVFQQLVAVNKSEFKCELIQVEKIGLGNKEDVYDFVAKGHGKSDILNLPKIPLVDISDTNVIEVDMAKKYEAMDKAEMLLVKKAPYVLFQRKESIVRIVDLEEDTYIKPMFRADFMADFLNRHFTFVKSTPYGLKEIEPPIKMVDQYLSRAGQWRLHQLKGITLSPTFRPDGSILDEPGYDSTTKLFYILKGEKFKPLADFPSDNNPEILRKIAIEQLKLLDDLLCDFKFIKEADKSVMLSSIFTSLTRKIYLTAPAFGFNSPVAGSGKTLLANIVHIIATGSPVTPMAMGFNREEGDKQLFAKLLEGRPIILIDNIDKPVKSGMFCEIQTSSSGKHSGRILGLSETKTVETDVTFLLTGNNLSFVGDLTRRVLMCSIDPKCEKPENRTEFKIPDLPHHIMKDRGIYMRAALTVMKAYQLAGRPLQNIPNWGGFENWSLWVRSPLVWCGYADPYLTQTEIEENDPDRTSINTIFQLWYEIYQSEPKKASEIVKDCNEVLEDNKTESTIFDLAQELLEVTAGKGKIINSNSVGQWLKSKHDRIMGNLKLVFEKQKTNVRKWRIYDLNRASSPR
jgi:putative DNA primase/helicase